MSHSPQAVKLMLKAMELHMGINIAQGTEKKIATDPYKYTSLSKSHNDLINNSHVRLKELLIEAFSLLIEYMNTKTALFSYVHGMFWCFTKDPKVRKGSENHASKIAS